MNTCLAYHIRAHIQKVARVIVVPIRGLKSVIWYQLRVLKVKITTAGVMVVPFRVLSRKYERR